MKKVIIPLILVFAVLTLGYAQDCVDCCTGSACDGTAASTPTLDVTDCLVRINDRTVKNDVTVLKAFERGQDLDIKVEFTSHQDAEDVQIAAFVTGYHRGSKLRADIFDITSTFDVTADVSYEKTLALRLPDDFKLSSGDELKLRIEISDKFSKSFIREYNLKVEAPDNNVVIQDVILDPADEVEAGRGLFASVRVKNMGDNDEESLKVTTAIPALNIKAVEYIDTLEADDSTTSEDMFLRIPICTEEGDYAVKVTVEYADGDEVVTKQSTVKVLANAECQSKPATGGEEKTIITVPGKQDVVKGTSGTVFPIILENKGVTDKSYQLSVTGLDSWATYRFDPGTLVLVKKGEVQTAYLYITAKTDAQVGEKVFMVTVETQGEKKQIALSGNVVEGQTQGPSGLDLGSLRQGLTIGVIVIVVLLIILGLIIGFNKLKGEGQEPSEGPGQTYY